MTSPSLGCPGQNGAQPGREGPSAGSVAGEQFMQPGLLVSSSGTGHVINFSQWSLLVPKLPLNSQFYISRTFQSPHLLQQHVQAIFLPPLRGTKVGNLYLLFAAQSFLPEGLAHLSRATSPQTTSTQFLPQVKTEEAARGSTERWRAGKQRTPIHRTPILPSVTLHITEMDIAGVLCFLSCRAPKKTDSLILVSLSRSGIFLDSL